VWRVLLEASQRLGQQVLEELMLEELMLEELMHPSMVQVLHLQQEE
jgi:hypothetical protein